MGKNSTAPVLERIPRQPRDAPLPLSFAQQRFWFLQQAAPESTAYHLSSTFRLQGPLDREALETSFNDLIARHESLRTIFVAIDGEAGQVVVPANRTLLPALDLSIHSPLTQQTELQRLLDDESQRPFDLTNGPLFRIELFKLGAKEHVLRVTLHHIITDGWSMNIVWKELSAFYTAHQSGHSIALPPLPIQYADYAQWHRQKLQGPILKQQIAYWTTHLADAPPRLTLPTDSLRPLQHTHRGSDLSFTLPAMLTHMLKTLSRQEGVTVFMTLLAAFQLLLARYSGQHDILVGTPTSGRTHPNLGGLIGFFVNTLVLRAHVNLQDTFLTFLQQVKKTCLEAYEHQDLPFQQLVERLQPVRDPSHHPIFQAMFQLYRHRQDVSLTLSNCLVEALPKTQHTAMFDLALSMEETPTSLTGRFIYSTDLFDTPTITRFASHYQLLLERLITHPDQPILKVPFLTAHERDQLLLEWNATTKPYPDDQCLHELIETQAMRTPHYIAIVYEGRSLTYQELNQKANHLARQLLDQGVWRGHYVPVLMERGFDLVIAYLAIMKAGAAFSPLDPNWPDARIVEVLTQLNSHIVLVAGSHRQFSELVQWTLLVVDHSQLLLDESNLQITVSLDDPMYVIFTSGSTGQPKGAINQYRGLVNRFFYLNDRYQCEEKDAILLTANPVFDSSITPIFWPLINGARTVIPPPTQGFDLARIVELIEQEQVTITDFVPSVFHLLVEYLSSMPQVHHCLRSLRQLLIGGETMLATPIEKFRAMFPSIGLTNTYGPTETCIAVIFYDVPEPCPDPIPIGRPLHNVYAVILDPDRQLVPPGVPGDLYVGGVCVGLGYLNDQEATDSVFVPNPYPEIPSAKLYKTGDKARYLPDGNIQFLGRADYQVKIRGHRIELGEIETRLRQQVGIQDTLVLCHEDTAADKQLVAYVVPVPGTSLHVDTLRSTLKTQLPDSMVPATFLILQTLPLTQTGKVDRRALPAPDTHAIASQTTSMAPQTPVEIMLAVIWCELLKVDHVGINDNFFELGGHSLLATRLLARLKIHYHIHLPLRVLFDQPTLAEQAITIEEYVLQEIENLPKRELDQFTDTHSQN